MSVRAAFIVAGQLPGTQTNDNAAAGVVGEFISALLGSGSAVALTTSTPANVTSISLTAGDWDVWGFVNFLFPASTTVTLLSGGVSQTSATLPNFNSGASQQIYASFSPGVGVIQQPVPMTRISLAATTTIFLVGEAAFATSTLSAYGGIFGRRRR